MIYSRLGHLDWVIIKNTTFSSSMLSETQDMNCHLRASWSQAALLWAELRRTGHEMPFVRILALSSTALGRADENRTSKRHLWASWFKQHCSGQG